MTIQCLVPSQIGLCAHLPLLREVSTLIEIAELQVDLQVFVPTDVCFFRGDADLEVEEWLWILQQQAVASGGAVYHLLGNHEASLYGAKASLGAESYFTTTPPFRRPRCRDQTVINVLGPVYTKTGAANHIPQ